MARRLAIFVGVFVLVAGSAFAQTATPVPTPEFNTATILEGSASLIGAYGLTALILVGAFVGLAFMIIRRFRRAAM